MDDRRTFFKAFFPKWRGFHVHSYDDIEPVEALKNLEYLEEGMSTYCTSTSAGHTYRNNVDMYKVELWKVGVNDQ